MGLEIERKFLVATDGWRGGDPGVPYRQGYLCTDPDRVVRVRTMGDRAALTVKGRAHGPVRAEFEYEIPVAEARELLAMCGLPPLEKTRYRVPHGAATWEVDVYHGANEGLVVAEIELESADQPFDRPDWVGREVTDDSRYSNSNLAARPYATW
jgi:CYTH domain-containing protein